MLNLGTTSAQKKLFFNLRRVKGQIEAYEDGDLKPEHVSEIAEKLGVSETDVVSMNQRMQGDSSLNAPLSKDTEGGGEWQDWLVDEGIDQETALGERQELDARRKVLRDAMEVLNEREAAIFNARRLKEKPDTLEVLSQEYGVSRERIRQIEVRAFEKIQDAVTSASAEA